MVFLFAVISIFLLFACSFGKRTDGEEDHRKRSERIYGITIDDSWYESLDADQVLAAIRKMPVKPTARIVMSEDISPQNYKKLFMQIKKEAYIMASPVDSYYMKAYQDEEAYLKRFQDSYDALSDYVDIWEIGNEINGVEWIRQDPELIIDKVSEANAFIRSKGGRTALTLYYTNPEEEDMFEWISEYFPDELYEEVDYVLLSYYEEDNEGYEPEWEQVFSSLEKVFPGAKLGIGECGNTAEDASVSDKIERARSYYMMESHSENFIGGYFWWNWVQDCVPHQNNKVYEEINRCME
ncbi:MAG: hypothetical protein Q4A19_01330 [Johnsonella sp.]|nr:hypothetical protein [Johnsonella sp.]